jgi:kinesin family protein 2/24
MMGNPKEDIPGLYLLASKDIFHAIVTRNLNLKVFVSFYEIYCDKAYDLLNEREECFVRVDE